MSPAPAPMVDAIATFHFAIDGLWLRKDALGLSVATERSGRRVEVDFPADFGSFLEDSGAPALSGWTESGDNEINAAAIAVLRTRAPLALPFAASDFGAGRPDPAAFDEGQVAIRQTLAHARAVVTDVVERVRVLHGQPWLGLSGAAPRLIGRSRLEEATAGVLIPTGPGVTASAMTINDSEDAIGRADLTRAVELGAPDDEADLPAVLLADARYLGVWSEPRQHREAVLLAAIACEVSIKSALRRTASESQAAILAWALDNPRDVSAQAAGLFDKAALAVAGRSLREENRSLFRSVEALFTERNRVAHRGAPLEDYAVRQHLSAAAGALAWTATL